MWEVLLMKMPHFAPITCLGQATLIAKNPVLKPQKTGANKFQQSVECSEEDEYMCCTYQRLCAHMEGHHLCLALLQTSQWYVFLFSSGYQPCSNASPISRTQTSGETTTSSRMSKMSISTNPEMCKWKSIFHSAFYLNKNWNCNRINFLGIWQS